MALSNYHEAQRLTSSQLLWHLNEINNNRSKLSRGLRDQIKARAERRGLTKKS